MQRKECPICYGTLPTNDRSFRVENSVFISLKLHGQIVVKWECTRAYRVNSTQLTLHVFYANSEYSLFNADVKNSKVNISFLRLLNSKY